MLKYTDLNKKYTHRINRGMSDASILELKEIIADPTHEWGIYDFNVYLPSIGMNLQRDYCWTLLQKQSLILSMLRGVTLPKFVKIYIKENGKKIHQVIDGKQRLGCIFDFIDGIFPVIVNDVKYYYNDLDSELQRMITDPAVFIWDIHYSYPHDKISDETKIDLFEQINFLGTPQEINHLNNLKKKQ